MVSLVTISALCIEGWVRRKLEILQMNFFDPLRSHMNAWWHKYEWPDDHPAPSLILFDVVDRNGIFSSGPDFGMSVLVGGWDSRVVITQTTGLDIVCEQNLQTHARHRLLCSESDESWSTGTSQNNALSIKIEAVEIWANIWITVILDRLCRMSPQLYR